MTTYIARIELRFYEISTIEKLKNPRVYLFENASQDLIAALVDRCCKHLKIDFPNVLLTDILITFHSNMTSLESYESWQNSNAEKIMLLSENEDFLVRVNRLKKIVTENLKSNDGKVK